MKTRIAEDEAAKAAFLDKVAILWPVARGRCLHVRKCDEALLAEEGVRMVESLRGED